MSFISAKKKLTKAQQKALDELLADWETSSGVPPHAAANIRAEKGSQLIPLAKFLAALADEYSNFRSNGNNPAPIFDELRRNFGLQGFDSKALSGIVFGRAVLLKKFAEFLQPRLDALNCLDTQEQIQTTLRSLHGKTKLDAPPYNRQYFDAIVQTPIGRDAVFATFAKPIATNQGPWAHPLPSAKEVRERVALGLDPPGEDYLLFTYRLPIDVVPRVPTSASPSWSYQKWFRPNPNAAKERHGWTAPLNSAFASLPEIVHPKIDGTTLIFPFYVVNP